MHDFDPIVSPYNGHMLRNLSKFYLFICCKQSSSTHFCHFLTTDLEIRGPEGSNPSAMCAKRKASITGGLTNQWWAMRDVACGFAARFRFGPAALACCAGKRFAFPQLRTLAGSNPTKWAHTKTVPFRGPFPIRWWAMRDVACGFAARFRFVASLLACFAGKRFAFPQLRTLPGSNPMCWAQKERPPSLEA